MKNEKPNQVTQDEVQLSDDDLLTVTGGSLINPEDSSTITIGKPTQGGPAFLQGGHHSPVISNT